MKRHLDDQSLTRHADACLQNLLNRFENETIRVKLGRMHAICRDLTLGKGRRLTIAGIATKYEDRYKNGPTLAEQSIRNKRGGANPYFELYEAWKTVLLEITELEERSRERGSSGEILSVKETYAIEPASLRHRVAQTIIRARGVAKERDMLRAQLSKGTTITIAPLPSKGVTPTRRESDPELSWIETEAIRKFLESLDKGLLQKMGDDSVKLDTGEYITESGFVAALTKVLKAADPIPF